MEGVAVGLGIDGHSLDAHLLAGQDHPQGDLAAVGDEDLLEGRGVRDGRGRGRAGLALDGGSHG